MRTLCSLFTCFVVVLPFCNINSPNLGEVPGMDPEIYSKHLILAKSSTQNIGALQHEVFVGVNMMSLETG